MLRTIAPGCYEEQSLEVTQQQYQGTRPVNLGGYPLITHTTRMLIVGYSEGRLNLQLQGGLSGIRGIHYISLITNGRDK